MAKRILNLKLNWSKAKSLQIAIAYAKGHIKKDTETAKELDEIERQLEDFTQSATMIMYLKRPTLEGKDAEEFMKQDKKPLSSEQKASQEVFGDIQEKSARGKINEQANIHGHCSSW